MPQENSPVEPVKACPYCGEEVFSRGLYLHVRNSDGGGHGKRGTVPKNFDPQEVEIVGYRSIQEDKYEGKTLRCKHCGNVFADITEATLHLKQAESHGKHPATADPDRSLLIVPEQVQKAKSKFRENAESPMSKYRRQYEGGFAVEQPQVPISVLEDLLAEYRDHEPECGAWSEAADSLEERLEPYRL